MIKIGDKEYRNLEEQVLKNKEDIANHYNVDRVLAEFGIKIIGTLGDADELENVPHPESYGDAYAVGREPPYAFYIWTRADAYAGHPEDYWLNIGNLAIAGPQGPQGPIGKTGPTGQRGSIWISRAGVPTITSMFLAGDQWLDTSNGNTYTFEENDQGKAWVQTGSIRGTQGIKGDKGEPGPQGERGPQGEPGPQGEGAALVRIIGTITDVNQLPDPESVLSNSAFLQDVNGAWHLWIIIGQPGSYQWFDTGDMTVGTLVTNNGTPVDAFDIQNVLDGPFEQEVIEATDGIPIVTSGLVYQYALPGASYGVYSVKVPVVAVGDVGPLGTSARRIASFDSWGRIGAIATNKISEMQLTDVPTTPTLLSTHLPLDYATPRAYVDAQIEYAGQKRVPWPTEIPAMGMLLGINPDKSVSAINPSDIEGKPVKVDCQIVKRGESLTLPRDKMYLIRGYGDNTVTLKNDQGATIAANFTMAFGAISSSNVEISDPTKTWAGFMYISNTSGVFPTINWNGNSHKDVIVYNNDSGTSGSGNLYVYSIGQSTTQP